MDKYLSSVDDVTKIAYLLKNVYEDRIYINTFLLSDGKLIGKFNPGNGYLNTRQNGIDFRIIYDRDRLLRLSIKCNRDMEESNRAAALEQLSNTLANMRASKRNIGNPNVSYKITNGNLETLFLEWVFSNIEEYVSGLYDGAIFKDGSRMKDVSIIDFNNSQQPNSIRQ